MKKIICFSLLLIISQFTFAQKYILVHGWTSAGSIWNGSKIKELIQNEFTYTNIYQPSLSGFQNAEIQSLNLRNYLNNNAINSGIAISHSMGGVNTRTHLRRQFNEGLPQRISQHYSIGTPHFGTKLANNSGDAALLLIVGALSVVYPTGSILDDPIQGLGFVYDQNHPEDFWVASSLLWGGNMLSDVLVDGLLNSPALYDLRTNSEAVANVNNNINYEADLIKVGIAATEAEPILFRTMTHALNNVMSPQNQVSEQFILDCKSAIEYFKLVRIFWALYDYYDDPNLYNPTWTSQNQ
ncbi:MAG: hypothetical protein Q8Q47_02470, partial [Ignavibacteriaceae bacterium]|nr:hypothetical protein [Ignavibacteriaceae bacterium]